MERDIEAIEPTGTIEQSVRNWEHYWIKRPDNALRHWHGLPEKTVEEFAREVILERDEVVAIARAQKEAWK